MIVLKLNRSGGDCINGELVVGGGFMDVNLVGLRNVSEGWLCCIDES